MGLLGITPQMVAQMRMRQQMQQQRMMGETPTAGRRGAAQNINVRMPKLTFENMVDTEEEKKAEEPAQQPSMFRRAMNGMSSVMSSIFWCNDRDEDELVNHERDSIAVAQKFRNDVTQNYRVISNNQQLKFNPWSESIPKLCIASIRNKKPILALVLKDGSPDDFRAGLSTFTRTDAATDLIAEKFLFTGFDM